MNDNPQELPGQFFPVVAAAILGAIVAAAPMVILTLASIEVPWNIVVVSEGIFLAELTCVTTFAHAMVLGLPTYFILRSRCRIGIVAAGCAGFLIGAVPFGALACFAMLVSRDAPSESKSTLVNHASILSGFVEYATSVGSAGTAGLLGGVTFWIVMRWCTGRSEGAAGDQRVWITRLTRSWVAMSLAVLLTGALFAAPHFVRDTSCHNLFRDGRKSVGPQVGVEMKLDPADWTKLMHTVVEFGDTNGLSLRRDEEIRHGRFLWRSLNLCNEAGLTIVVSDQPWLGEIHSPQADRGMTLDVYQLKQDSGWQPMAGELLDKLEAQWPGRLTFRGPSGSVIPRDEAMLGRE